MKRHTPSGIRPPFANYAHGVEVPANARWLVCSGQLGMTVEDVVPEGAEAQADLCFTNIRAILASAGMELEDVVRINAYVSGRAHMAGYMAARDRAIAKFGQPPASTLMIVSGFTREDLVVEIEALAAKVD